MRRKNCKQRLCLCRLAVELYFLSDRIYNYLIFIINIWYFIIEIKTMKLLILGS